MNDFSKNFKKYILMYNQVEQFKICILESQSDQNNLCYLVDYLQKMGYKNVSRFIIKRNCFEELMEIESIISQKFDIYFNLCDGLIGLQVEAGPEAVRYVTYANVPFVGPDINCAQPSRNQMKDVCRQHNIKTPAFQFVFDLQNDIKKLDVLKFPLIVKHYNSAGSWGMTRQSKVTNKQDLRIQLQRMLKLHGGSIVQQFIPGRQFTCLVSQSGEEDEQPYAYDPVEFTFKDPSDDFKYEEIKMIRYKQMQAGRILQKEIREEIKTICIKFFKAMKCRSYARVDIRMNPQNQIYVLQINPYPAMFYAPDQAGSADQILLKSEGHSAFINRLIKSALLCYKNKKPQKEVNVKQLCFNEMKKQMKVRDLKLPHNEEVKILLNLYYQSLQENNQYRAGLSKDILQLLRKEENREIEYIFNEDELKKLEQ